MRSRTALLPLVATVLALAACSGTPEGADEPGAIVLKRNIPTTIGECRVAAANIDDASSDLTIEEPDEPEAQWHPVTQGDEVTVCETTYSVRTVDAGADNGEGQDGAVVLVPLAD